jgi:trimethylguanosine synthase
MGKRSRGGIAGLARFLHAINLPNSPPSSPEAPEHHVEKHKPDDSLDPTVSQSASNIKSNQDGGTGLLGIGNEKYDATGLVPHYTNANQVPASLQKCSVSSPNRS